MGDLAAVAFVILLLIGIVIAAAALHNHVVRGRRRWQKAGQVAIWATCPDERPICIGTADVEDPDFLDKIEEIRSEGQMKLAALNSGRKVKNWRLEEHSDE